MCVCVSSASLTILFRNCDPVYLNKNGSVKKFILCTSFCDVDLIQFKSCFWQFLNLSSEGQELVWPKSASSATKCASDCDLQCILYRNRFLFRIKSKLQQTDLRSSLNLLFRDISANVTNVHKWHQCEWHLNNENATIKLWSKLDGFHHIFFKILNFTFSVYVSIQTELIYSHPPLTTFFSFKSDIWAPSGSLLLVLKFSKVFRD